MHFQLPVRQYLQTSEQTCPPTARFGSVQWVLARPLYRYQTFDLAQVPLKNRPQALQLELTQWTPFSQSAYYIAWHASTALVWCWQADKTQSAISAQSRNPKHVTVLPETLLRTAQADGLHLMQCLEGFEGQFWQQQHLQRSRWWPQTPSADEWLSFQRDAAVAPGQQQAQVPQAQTQTLQTRPWISAGDSAENLSSLLARPALALAVLALATPALWYAINIITLQQSTTELLAQQAQLQQQAQPILQARSQALDHLARIQTLQALNRYPTQLDLMARIAAALPKNDSSVKDWDYSAHQLKITLSASADIAATPIIEALQKAGPFSDVKALPGRDPKSVMFQMNVLPQ